MAKSKYAWTSWESMTEYAQHKPEYKEQARQLLIDALGFEPKPEVSMIPEMRMRTSLEQLAQGEITQDKFNTYLKNMARYIKGATQKHCPEQTYLINS